MSLLHLSIAPIFLEIPSIQTIHTSRPHTLWSLTQFPRLRITYVCRWLQIAARTKKMESAGSSLSRRATIGITTAATFLGVLFIALGLMGMLFLMSALSSFLTMTGIVVYFVAASKLVLTMDTGKPPESSPDTLESCKEVTDKPQSRRSFVQSLAAGNKNETGRRIITLTRRLACSMLCTVLFQALFTIIVGNTSLFIPEMLIAALLMPTSYSAFHILIFSFIKDSFARALTRASSRGTWSKQTRSKKSSASVAPATSFSDGGTSSGTGGV